MVIFYYPRSYLFDMCSYTLSIIWTMYLYIYMCACVCACVRACVRACVHACVRACVREFVCVLVGVCEYGSLYRLHIIHISTHWHTSACVNTYIVYIFISPLAHSYAVLRTQCTVYKVHCTLTLLCNVAVVREHPEVVSTDVISFNWFRHFPAFSVLTIYR